MIYLVRDPRDVAVSRYHFHVKFRNIDENYPIDLYTNRFIAGELEWGGSWGENVGSWLGARAHNPEFLLLKYEQILEQPIQELRKVAKFLEIEADEERISRAVELSAPERMRRSELKHGHLWQTTKASRSDKPFVRKAKSGSWRSELPPTSVMAIEKAWLPLMKAIGYSPARGNGEIASPSESPEVALAYCQNTSPVVPFHAGDNLTVSGK